MSENNEEVIEQPVEQEEQTEQAIFLRRVDVVIQNGEDEEPIIIKADSKLE